MSIERAAAAADGDLGPTYKSILVLWGDYVGLAPLGRRA